MLVMPASFIRYRHGRYSRNEMDRDLEAIRDLYRSNGFRDVVVTSRVLDDYNGAKAHIAIFIDIKEGPQWFVSNLSLQGVSDEFRAALLLFLHSTAGQPYSDFNIATDRDSILDYYFNSGYPAAKFEFTSTPAPEPNHMNLTFIVTPGPRVYVRDVLVAGLKRTQPDLVRDRISLAPGDPLSESQINGSQRRLYDLGIFSRVDAAIQNPDGDEPSKYVLYSLEEAGRYSMNVGVGAEIGRIGGGTTSLDSPAGTTGFSPRFSFGISRLNFLGLGHTFGLQTLVSTLEQRALLTYVAPQFEGNPKLSLTFSGLFDHSHDVRTFSAQRLEGSVQLAQKLSRANTLQYRYTYRKVKVLGVPLISADLIPLLSQPVNVGFFSMSFIQDKRDDPIDSHRGMYTSIDLALASNVFGSQTGFGRVVARNSTYYSLTKNVVLARTTDFGLIERYAGLPEIPLAERFFGGGAFSNRAFPDFQAGPRDLSTGFPIGGNALFMNTVELRFPLIGDNLGGVLFNDIGNVYSAVNKIGLGFRQPQSEGLRLRRPSLRVRDSLSDSARSGPRGFFAQPELAAFLRLRRLHQPALFLRRSRLERAPDLPAHQRFPIPFFAGPGVLMRMFGCLLLAAVASALSAEIIDRIAIAVGNQVITESQIDEEIRITAFLNREKLDVSADSRKQAADRLIEQALVKREMGLSHYPLPQAGDANAAVADIAAMYPSPAEFAARLEVVWHYGSGPYPASAVAVHPAAFYRLSVPARHSDPQRRCANILSGAGFRLAEERDRPDSQPGRFARSDRGDPHAKTNRSSSRPMDGRHAKTGAG